MLVYLSGTILPWHELCEKGFGQNQKEDFETLKKLKMGSSSQQICKDKSKWLRPFYHKVSNFEFEEEPNYGHLKHLLIAAILETEKIPDMKFDFE